MDHLQASEREKPRLCLYDFCSLFLIPFLTLLMAFGFSWTDTNFSVIGNHGGRRLVFLLWGALTGNFFYLYTENLIELVGCEDRLARGLLFSSLLFFVTAVGIPYLPERFPGLARLHVNISFLSPVLLGVAQARFLYVLQKKSACFFWAQWMILCVLGVEAAILYFIIGIISSLLEILLILGICLYLWLLHQKLEKLRLLNSC